MSDLTPNVWLGMGGNIGDVEAAMSAAIKKLADHPSIEVKSVSSLYKTPPWGVEAQPWFLNCCVAIVCELSPEELLDLCQRFEQEGKRERIVRWGPRTIDIDILVFEGEEQTEQRLTIPHPRITERAFVLLPLAEIAPDLQIKGQGAKTLSENISPDGIECLTDRAEWWKH